MFPCLVVATVAALGQDSPTTHRAEVSEQLAGAREGLERALGGPGVHAEAKLKLVAVLLLQGETRRAAELATELFGAGALSVSGHVREGAARLLRAYELLIRQPSDPEGAAAVLEEAAGRDQLGTGDIAWPFARALVLARSGESHRAAHALDTLARRLRQGAGLDVNHFRFVRSVTSFGIYEEDPRRACRPGEALLAYAEAVGVSCDPHGPTPDGVEQWCVRLRATFVLRDRLHGNDVATWGPEEITLATKSELHDLHITRRVDIPRGLGPGSYELRLRIEDLSRQGIEGLGIRRVEVVDR